MVLSIFGPLVQRHLSLSAFFFSATSGDDRERGEALSKSDGFIDLIRRRRRRQRRGKEYSLGNQIMSALFNFHSFLTVVLLVICTCTYIKIQFPTILEHRTGFRGFFWKAARIGERLSPWVAVGCFAMGVSILVF